MSRAIEQVRLFHSVQLDDLSNKNDLRYKLLDHFKNYKSYQPILNSTIERRLGTQPEPFDSWFEVDVYNDIVSKQLSVIPQYEVAKGRYRIDLVALFPDGTKIAIECDGDKWHGAEQYENDMMRQKVLERCGWQFFRVRGYEYYTNKEKALEPLWKMIPEIEEVKKPIRTIKSFAKFIFKLHVAICKYHGGGIVTWSLDGTSFIVKNTKEFATTILPTFCSTKSFSSFERQIHFYS